MKNDKKNERKRNQRIETLGEVMRCRRKINDALDEIEKEGNERFLNQILTILNKHIEKRGY